LENPQLNVNVVEIAEGISESINWVIAGDALGSLLKNWDLGNLGEKMLNDTLSNALNNIMNAEIVGKETCLVKTTSKVIKSVLGILKDNYYLGDIKHVEDGRGGIFIVNLIGKINKTGVIKPRFSVNKDGFEKFEKRFLPAKNFGVLVVSTSKGIMTHHEAKKNKIGGRLLAYCY